MILENKDFSEKFIQVILGALLHDIGKPVQRAQLGYSGRHGHIGRTFLKKTWLKDERLPKDVEAIPEKNLQFSDTQKIVLDAVSFHHSKELRAAIAENKVPNDSPVFISYIADNIAAGADRRKAESEDDPKDWNSETPLASVFNVFGDQNTSLYHRPELMDDREPINFALDKAPEFDKYQYTEVTNKLASALADIGLSREYVTSVLNALEATLSFVPSSTDASEAVDISLYDHLKLTGAFASAIYYFLEANGIDDYKKELFDNSSKFYEKQAFLLTSFDLSGIQDFIYTIHTSGASKQLRSRSFYIEILAEHLVDELLAVLGLSRSSLMYSGGGHAYLLLPNTDEVKEKLNIFEGEVNSWFLKEFGTSLYIALAYEPFAADVVMRNTRNADSASSINSAEEYEALYRAISEKIGAKKLSRYSAEQIKELNSLSFEGVRECEVCHRADESVKVVKIIDEEHTLCGFCKGFLELSNGVLDEDFVIVGDLDSGIPVPFGKKINFANKQKAVEAINAGSRIYAKNKFYEGPEQGVHLWVGDYWDSRDFSSYVSNSQGIDRLGVLRLDVDNLSTAFTSGFTQKDKKFNTISRTSSLSRVMSVFFRQHINFVLQKPSFKPITKDVHSGRKISIIYSGGDDVFAVGGWDDILEFAVDLRRNFHRYTQGKLTVSAGIGVYPDKYPVSVFAKEVGYLESLAKKTPNKNSVAVFDSEFVFDWDTLEKKVFDEKYALISEYFDSNKEVGKAFIYKLLQLLRSRNERISLARWVYFLSRMEPREEIEKARFREFANRLHSWFQDADEANELILALIIYVYKTRED